MEISKIRDRVDDAWKKMLADETRRMSQLEKSDRLP
jgi:hypothetical protein